MQHKENNQAGIFIYTVISLLLKVLYFIFFYTILFFPCWLLKRNQSLQYLLHVANKRIVSLWCFRLSRQNTGVLTVRKWTSRHARRCPCNSLGRKMALLASCSQTCVPSCFRRTQIDPSRGSIQWILNLLSSSMSLCHVKPSQEKIKPTEPYWKQSWVAHPWLSYSMREHTWS